MPPIEPLEKSLRSANLDYQKNDSEFFDYKLFKQFLINMRGPVWDPSEPCDFNFVGSARTFGRLVSRPFTEILTEEYGIISRNIGYNGCVPTSILENDDLMSYLKNSTGTPVIQLCALDGGASDWYIPARNRRVFLTLDNVTVKNKQYLRRVLKQHNNSALFAKKHSIPLKKLRHIIQNNPKQLPDQLPVLTMDRASRLLIAISETRSPVECIEQIRKTQNWALIQYKDLVQKLNRKVILLSFYDQKRPFLDENNFMDVALSFPQFVDSQFIGRVSELFDYHIEVVGRQGKSFTKPGNSSPFKDQYPTQVMHENCARIIAEWKQQSSNSPIATGR